MITAPLKPDPGLYVTATPIGNLGDITYRAVALLKAADLILCEDTRRTAKLCDAYGVETRRSPYHDHNAARLRPGIIKKLQDGAVICLVSDAGTPLISDPGYKLVKAAREVGIVVRPVPGPSAAIAALSAAGAPSDQFVFAGFPPAKAAARDRFFAKLAAASSTLIFYEIGARLSDSLNAMADAFGDRRATIAREITKLHEEFCDGALSELADRYRTVPPKGEIVIIVHGVQIQAADPAAIDGFLKEALRTMSVKDAAAAAAEQLGAARNEAYRRALALKDLG